jgi:hypothetical protein
MVHTKTIGIMAIGAVIVAMSCIMIFLSVSGFRLLESAHVLTSSALFGIVVVWTLYVPFCISGIAVLYRKEWGRKLAVIMSLVLFSWSLCYVILYPAGSNWVSFAVYVIVFIYLTGPKVKVEFK